MVGTTRKCEAVTGVASHRLVQLICRVYQIPRIPPWLALLTSFW